MFVLIDGQLAHSMISFLLLVNGFWFALLLNAPLVLWHINKFIDSDGRLVKNNYTYDATEIFRSMPEKKQECFIKMGFYLMMFFYYLYRILRFNL